MFKHSTVNTLNPPNLIKLTDWLVYHKDYVYIDVNYLTITLDLNSYGLANVKNTWHQFI